MNLNAISMSEQKAHKREEESLRDEKQLYVRKFHYRVAEC